MNATEALNRANDFVAGAEASFNAGALASCALCCYAAVFWAQIAVLERLGFRQPKWSHEGVKEQIARGSRLRKTASDCDRTCK